MTTQLNWYLENHVILVANEGVISDQDMLAVDQPITDYMSQSNAPLVHLIVDNTKAIYSPSVKTVTQVKFPKHPQCGWILLVGPTNTFTRFVNAVVSNVFKSRNRMFDTRAEALDFLNEVDSTLPPLRERKPNNAGQALQ